MVRSVGRRWCCLCFTIGNSFCFDGLLYHGLTEDSTLVLLHTDYPPPLISLLFIFFPLVKGEVCNFWATCSALTYRVVVLQGTYSLSSKLS